VKLTSRSHNQNSNRLAKQIPSSSSSEDFMKDKRSTSGACSRDTLANVENLNMAVNQKSGNLTKQENHVQEGF
jgi:hypothetical protein